jgi:hypothetical protein
MDMRGYVYFGDEAVKEAEQRGEPLIELSEEEALRLAELPLAEREEAAKEFIKQGRAYRIDPVTGLKLRIEERIKSNIPLIEP